MQKLSIISNYLLSGPVSPDSLFVRIGFITAAVIFLLGIGSPLLKRFSLASHLQDFIQKLAVAARWGGGLLLILFFFQNQDMEPFDMRLWPILVALVILGYSIVSLIRFRKQIPVVIKRDVREEKYEKYLPKPKAK